MKANHLKQEAPNTKGRAHRLHAARATLLQHGPWLTEASHQNVPPPRHKACGYSGLDCRGVTWALRQVWWCKSRVKKVLSPL